MIHRYFQWRHTQVPRITYVRPNLHSFRTKPPLHVAPSSENHAVFSMSDHLTDSHSKLRMTTYCPQ